MCLASSSCHPSVAPFVGAWIEIEVERTGTLGLTVAPFVGAWIEMSDLSTLIILAQSLRSSERGLKLTGHRILKN